MTELVPIDEIRAAARALPPIVRRTPLWPFARDPEEIGRERLFLKLEIFQPTGAYKVRAAFTMLAALTPEQRLRGVVLTCSANFAQAFALAGRHFGTRICVVMPAATASYQIEAMRALGGEVDLFDGPGLERQRRVEDIGREQGMTAIDASEDRSIIAGHGTLGLEILEDMNDVEQILVPVGSGGMAAGVAAAVKQVASRIRVIGVQPVGANAAYLSLKAGKPISIDSCNTVADGLSARCPSENSFRHMKNYLDEIVLVEERDIAVAHTMLRRRAKIIAEPAGAVAAAAFTSGRVDVNRRTVAVVSEGNLTDETMHTLERMAESKGE